MESKLPEVTTGTWESCLADPFHGIAFFDGLKIDTDKLTDPRWNRVFPILEEEQIVMCRNMARRGIFAPGRHVLDVGTGSGVLAIYAAAHGSKVEAIDQCPRAARTAEHNLRHPCNQAKMQKAGGEVSRPRVISIKDFAASGLNKRKFDVILLNPPFNPTAPGLPAASHAAAGPDGNECLLHQLPHALHLVSPGGVVAGVQMFLHDAGQGADWWKTRLDEAIASQGNAFAPFHITMAYSPLVETETIDARTFLYAQYEHFLNPHLRLFPDDVRIRRYIDDIAPKDTGRQFSYVYYEIRLGNRVVGEPLEPAITRIPQIFSADSHGKTWKDRLVLHRAIVEHTSLNHSVPVPALFLENDFTPALPKHASQTSTNGRDLYEQSPLSSALRWIVQARMLSKEIGFGEILIDVGPWFDSWEGRRALHQEGLVCTGPLGPTSVTPDGPLSETARLSKAHQANVRSLQKCKIPPLLHPELSGLTSPDEWRPAFFQELAGTRRPPGFTEEDENLADRLFAQVSSEFESSSTDSNSKSGEEIDITDFDGVSATFSTCSLPDLDLPNFSDFESSLLKRCRINGLQNPSLRDKATLRKDMELLQWVFHRRIRNVFDCTPEAVTVLMAIPISAALAERMPHQGKLPGTFRGVIWVFAKLSSHFGPLQESLFTDLGRICWMLESESIAQDAAKSLGTTLARRYQGTFAHEIRELVDSIDIASDDKIRRNIREYFRMLCLTPRDFTRWSATTIWTEISTDFPEGFASGKSITRFVENHYSIAKTAAQLPDLASGKDQIRQVPGMLFHNGDHLRVSSSYLPLHGPPVNLPNLCSFSMALIACLKNIFKHADPKESIDVVIERYAITFRNKRKSLQNSTGGTSEVLQSHLLEYASDQEKDFFRFQEDPDSKAYWITQLPFPSTFFE